MKLRTRGHASLLRSGLARRRISPGGVIVGRRTTPVRLPPLPCQPSATPRAPRTGTGRRTLAAAAVALLLAGCGSVHPGAAAVVGDTTISMGRADGVATVYCQLALVSAPEGTPVSNAEVRRQAVIDLVIGVVAGQMADDANVTPNASKYEINPAQRKEIAASFADDEVDAVVDAINASQRTLAIAELLADERNDDPDAEVEQMREQGIQLIQAEIGRLDVQFDPRFGIADDGTQKAVSGSLSVPVKAPDPAAQEGLPATQQCTR